MARTLADIVADVRTKLDRGTGFDDAIRSAIQNIIHLNRAERLGFNQVVRATTFASELVSLSASILHVDDIRLDSGNAYERLHAVPSTWILTQRKSPTYTSEPIYYAIERDGRARKVRLYPAPDETYSAQMICLVDLTAGLSASWSDALELAWFDDARLMLIYGALAEVNMVHIGGDEAAAEARKHEAMYERARRTLIGEVRATEHSGSITPVL